MMEDEGSKEWRNLTFSQREGKAPLPEALQVGKLTKKFRNKVWLIMSDSIETGVSFSGMDNLPFDRKSLGGKYWLKFPSLYQCNIQNIPHDIIGITNPREARTWLSKIIIDGEARDVLTLLEHMLRISSTPENLVDDIEKCFEFAPYLIDRVNEPVCIIPTTSAEMKENIKRALENIHQSELTGANSHLGKAVQALNHQQFADSIRESMHAVESAARQIAPKSPNTLMPALDSLKESGMIRHRLLTQAFMKLYDYTNDEKGIRHALIDSDKANVGFDEAVFMYGACVSFVDYLVSKKSQLERNDTA